MLENDILHSPNAKWKKVSGNSSEIEARAEAHSSRHSRVNQRNKCHHYILSTHGRRYKIAKCARNHQSTWEIIIIFNGEFLQFYTFTHSYWICLEFMAIGEALE